MPPDPEQMVRDLVATGMTLDAVAASLRSGGVSPIEATKALRHGADLPLAEAKLLVDNSLPSGWRAANERLRDAAEQALQTDDE